MKSSSAVNLSEGVLASGGRTEQLHVTDVRLQDAAARHRCDVSKGQFQHESRCFAHYLQRLTGPADVLC